MQFRIVKSSHELLLTALMLSPFSLDLTASIHYFIFLHNPTFESSRVHPSTMSSIAFSMSHILFPPYPSLSNQEVRQISIEREVIVISDDECDLGDEPDESAVDRTDVSLEREVIVISDDDDMEASDEDEVMQPTSECIPGCPQNVDQCCTGPSGKPLVHIRIPFGCTFDELLFLVSPSELEQIHEDGASVSVWGEDESNS
jgi:hypothetical protein